MHEVEYLGKVLSDISPLKMLIRWQVYQIITSSKVIGSLSVEYKGMFVIQV